MKTLPIILISIFFISLVSAIEIDNIKIDRITTFDGKTSADIELLQKYKPLEVKNFFGLGATLFEGYISKHDETCGSDCESIIEIKLNEDSPLVEDIKFLTIKEDGSSVEQSVRSYKLYLKVKEEEYKVDDYEFKCVDNGKTTANGTKIQTCSNVLIGYHLEKRPLWEEYKLGEVKPVGIYELKLEGKKAPSRTVDWVIKTNGEWLNSWATWGEEINIVYNSSILGYWKMDETAGTNMSDSTNQNRDFLITSALVNYGGKINSGFNFTNNTNGGANRSDWVGLTTYPMSFSIWINTNSSGVEDNILFLHGNPAGEGTDYGFVKSTANKLKIVWRDGVNVDYTQGTISINNGSWINIIGVMSSSSNLKLYLNGNLEVTASIPVNFDVDGVLGAYVGEGFDGLLDELVIWNKALNSTEIAQVSAGLPYGTGGSVTLNSPSNNSALSNVIVTLNATGSISAGGATIVNASFYDNSSGSWAVRNSTIGLSGTSQTITYSNTYTNQQSYLWNMKFCDSDGNCGFATNNYTFKVDFSSPTISLNYPTSLINYGVNNSTLNLSITATDLSLSNVWYNYNGTNVTLIGALSGVANLSNITLSSKKNVTIYANDSAGDINSTTISWDYKVFENSRTFNSTSYETAYETYLVNLNSNSSLTNVYLNRNGTYYTATNSSGNWSVSFDLPSSATGNNFISWIMTYAGINITGDTSQQYINYTLLTLCNSTYNTQYFNITFKDESNLSSITAKIPSAEFIYYLGSGTVNKTSDYVNNTENYNYSFCASPTDRNLTINPYVQYSSSTHPQRIWNPDALSYSNSTTNQILYLLSSTDGIFVTFQVLSAFNDVISGVKVTGIREISGSTTTVAQGTTDSSGGVTFWLNPDFSHIFTFIKSGYDTYTTTLTPTQSTYTIVLGGTSVSVVSSDYSKGINYQIKPSNDFLSSNTIYNFNYTISTSYWLLDSWGFTLRYNNGTLIGTQTSTSDSGGILTLNANTSNQTKVIMSYYYIVNSTQINGTKYWLISESNDFSLWYFFQDLSTYINANLFGILGDDGGQFSKALISVSIIILVVGGLIMRYGIQNEAVVMGMITGLLFFLNTVNLLPDASPFEGALVSFGDLLVYLAIIMTIGFIIKGEQQ